jgi:hypothetical protein
MSSQVDIDYMKYRRLYLDIDLLHINYMTLLVIVNYNDQFHIMYTLNYLHSIIMIQNMSMVLGFIGVKEWKDCSETNQ